MSRLFVVLIASLLILIILLLNSIFFGTNSYQKKADLINENDIQIKKNNDIKNQNDILEFEIKMLNSLMSMLKILLGKIKFSLS